MLRFSLNEIQKFKVYVIFIMAHASSLIHELLLPFCKMHTSHINFGLNHGSHTNPLPPSYMLMDLECAIHLKMLSLLYSGSSLNLLTSRD